jgi:DNA-binding beta-propeller fold protein YncE
MTQNTLVAKLALLCCAMLCTVGCGSFFSTCHDCPPPPPQSLQVAYVANYTDNTVSGYVIDGTNGSLSSTIGGAVLAGIGPFSIAVVPSGKYAYVANANSNDVSGYSIDLTTGSLTPLSGGTYPAGTNPAGITVDPSGKFVYVADYQSGDITGFRIDTSTGALVTIPGSPFSAASEVIDVAVDPTGQFAYAAGQRGTLSAYRIDAQTGALSEVPGSPFLAGPEPSSVQIEPTGKFLYVTNETTDIVYEFMIDAGSGAASPIGTTNHIGQKGNIRAAFLDFRVRNCKCARRPRGQGRNPALPRGGVDSSPLYGLTRGVVGVNNCKSDITSLRQENKGTIR